MPRHTRFLILLALVSGLMAAPAAAQRLPFERVIDVTPGATVDVSTIRGKVTVRSAPGRQVRIDGTVTLRAGIGGITVPSDALELARYVADHPRIDVAGNIVRLRPPLQPNELQAVTVSYELQVPRDTTLVIATDSGAIVVDDMAGPVTVTTESSAIDVSRLAGKAEIKTGSGAVHVDRATGGLHVVTQSSAITLRGLSGGVDARTQSGSVRASFAAPGAADVETGSSAIQIDGLSGGLTARSNSGRVDVRGNPTAVWNVTTGSSLIDVAVEPAAGFTLDATSGSSSVQLKGVAVDGLTAKGRASGKVGGGGPMVRLVSRSGQIHIGH